CFTDAHLHARCRHRSEAWLFRFNAINRRCQVSDLEVSGGVRRSRTLPGRTSHSNCGSRNNGITLIDNPSPNGPSGHHVLTKYHRRQTHQNTAKENYTERCYSSHVSFHRELLSKRKTFALLSSAFTAYGHTATPHTNSSHEKSECL